MEEPSAPIHRRVAWFDATLRRPGWRAAYASVGASLRSIDLIGAEGVANCWLAVEDLPSYRPADDDTRRVLLMMRKLLGRGTCPPLHPDAERELLDLLGHADEIADSQLPGDVAPRLRRRRIVQVSMASPDAHPVESYDDLTDAESPGESAFLGWLGEHWSSGLRWCVPQASLDDLLRSRGQDSQGARRCDFLLNVPGSAPLVVEIDGGQHASQGLIDDERDHLLRGIGVESLRVRSEEMAAGDGPALEELRRLAADSADEASELDPAAWAPVQVHRLVLSLTEALANGFLAGDRWTVELVDPTGLAARLIGPYLSMLAALESLWGSSGVAPETVLFRNGGESISYSRTDKFRYEGESVGAEGVPDCRIRLECQHSPLERLPDHDDVPTIVVRSTTIPVSVVDPQGALSERVPVRTDREEARAALRVLLRAVFAKADFRDGQYEAISELLEGRDCAVLLPTGAGKSLIYQLAGLCLPGRTIVIDPIVALIEDQIHGLAAHGIDRAIGITSQTTRTGQTENLLRRVADADAYFVLVAPERLQMSQFRSALRELAATTPINLAVIDEAHCVSEWGHNFRTSYLNLGRTLRTTCRDNVGTPPPLLALTGTASRAVLKDVLFQLGIEETTPHSIVRPSSFDRPELSYRIVRTDSSADEATLRSVVKSLPDRFGESRQTFFEPDGDRTFSGLVFVPTVNGKHGLLQTRRALQEIVSPGLYSGKPPKGENERSWPVSKAEKARRFKANDLPVLITTNAFGMGIDKPNIRWVVHYGIPTSLESYYQEVGRAGRDGQRAECVLILSEFDPARNAQLLAEDVDLEAARARQAGMSWSQRDDLTTALFFHTNSFPGAEEEVDTLLEVVDLIEPDDQPRLLTIPFGHEPNARERALHRLAVLGVVDDYLVEFGAKEFSVRTAGVTSSSIVEHLLAFVERSQPGRLESMQTSVDRRYSKVADAIEACGRAMVDFVYATIERARRRSLREMYLTARESDTDAELRRRVLEYLSEGDISPILAELVDRPRFRFSDWVEFWANDPTGTDARELRAASARLLASYPSHPGLLATRGLAEAFLSDGNLDEFESNLESAIRAGKNEYQVQADDLEKALAWMLTTLSARRPPSTTALVGAVILAGHDSPAITEWLRANWADHGPGLALLGLAERLDDALDLAQTAADTYQEL